MAYLSNYTYDIFISYSHVDNATIFGQQDGWIENFYKNLSLLLAKRLGKMDAVNIWWDNKNSMAASCLMNQLKLAYSILLLCSALFHRAIWLQIIAVKS